MIRNLLALVGLVVVAQKGLQFISHYLDIKKENEFLHKSGSKQGPETQQDAD
ncbi:hypothetical protein [Castellaniella sp.]|uniref:hypothetical protein n=1 Tax=Castellaniella sp. TaxID=1955812 RepID=UPI002AFE1675|nr:hypothetical protein [Castellaniella sp.]